MLTPFHALPANGIAERVVPTLRHECVNHVDPLNERPLPLLLLEYVDHCGATEW